MTPADAADLFAYTAWANAEVFDAASRLGAEPWTRDLGGSFPSLQTVLAHTAGGERVWLDRWTGRAPTTFPAWTEDPSPADLRAAWDAVERERDAWLTGLTDADLAAPRPYTLFSGTASAEPLRDQVQHLVNHSTYHRGQAAALLRQHGVPPPSTDFIRWARLGRPARATPDA